MDKDVTITLTPAEWENLLTAIEGAIEELQTLEKDLDWFVSDTPDRLRACMEMLGAEPFYEP